MDNLQLQDWLYYILLMVYIITIIGTVIVIISENRNPVKSIAWIVVLIFLPIIGLLFYIFLGQDFRKQKMISKKSLKKIKQYNYFDDNIENIFESNKSYEQQIKLLYNLKQSRLFKGNKVDTYIRGKDFFSSMIREIEKAKYFIHIEFYIFQNDNLGNIFKNLLIQKAKEGVEIRVIYDDVGCWSVKKKFFKEMQDNGIDVKVFLKVRFTAFAKTINQIGRATCRGREYVLV